jgi:hypothetical protein
MGPAKFHPMMPRDLGETGDQFYRLFNIPADIYVVQKRPHGLLPVSRTPC